MNRGQSGILEKEVRPTSDEQIQFLVSLQRLLDEGQFVASFKFALLLSLADLCVEMGNDSGSALTLTTDAIGDKFIQYYWRQAIPYPAASKASVLQQNTGKQAAVINLIGTARRKHGDSIASIMKQTQVWKKLRDEVSRVVRIMPMWKLQTVGGKSLDFLYENVGAGMTIELRPGVAYCFRKFHALISDLVRGTWLRYVRQLNLDILGETADLNQFLFGSERAALAIVRPILIDIQQGRCFFCNKPLSPPTTHVDTWLRAFDLNLRWSHEVGEKLTRQTNVGFYNLFNFANFDLPSASLNGLLTGAAGQINGTTPQSHNIDRVGVGTGVYSLGAPRQIEFGLRIVF